MMTKTYGRLTPDHGISLAAMGGVLLSLISLRYTNKFYLIAGFYSLLLLSSIVLTSIFDYTGINSALLPLLAVGVVLNGFISGWRMVAGFAVAGIALIWFLYALSAGAPTGALFDPNLFASRNIQRAIQASLALITIGTVCSLFSYHMHATFTQLEEKISQVERARERKNKFLADMSHELRTPMNGVLGFVQLLDNTDLDAKQDEFVGIVKQSADVMMAIVNDALEMAKLDADDFALSINPFDLEQLLQSVIQLHTPTAKRKDLNLQLSYAPDLPRAFDGDENRIRQIVNQLVNNAIKFTSQGAVHIRVSVEALKSKTAHLSIAVIDTGIGMAESEHEKIFERFHKVLCQNSQQYEGTGMGLSVASELAARMNGTISLNSALGEGSTFSLLLDLPLAEVMQPVVPEAGGDVREPVLKRVRRPRRPNRQIDKAA